MLAVSPAFDALPPNSRDALAVLALESEPWVSRTHWQERVGDAGIVDERNRKIAGAPFKEIVDHAVAIGAVLVNERHAHALSYRWLVPVLESARRRGTLERMVLHLGMARRYTYSSGIGAKGALLVALVTGDARALEQSLTSLRAYSALSTGRTRGDFLVDTLGLEAPLDWLARLTPELRTEYLRAACRLAFIVPARLGAGVREAAAADDDPEVRGRFVTVLSLAGEPERARAILERAGTSQWERGARAFAALTEGRIAEARALFAEAAVGSRKQRVELPDYLAAFDLLLAVTSDSADEVADVPRRLQRAKRQLADRPFVDYALEALVAFRRTGRAIGPSHCGPSWLDAVVGALRDAWTGREAVARPHLPGHASRAKARGYAWLASELERIEAGRGESSLLALFGDRAKQPWELALDALGSAAAEVAASQRPPSDKTSSGETAELWWTLTVHAGGRWVEVDAHLVARRAAKGKKISVRRLLENDDDGVPLTEQDRRVAHAVVADRDHAYHGLPGGVLLALVGHPRVRDELGNPLRIESREPKIQVEPTQNGARLRLVPSTFDHSGVSLVRERDESGESGDRLVVVKLTSVASRVLQVLTNDGVEVPSEGLPRMAQTLGAMGAIIGVDAAESLAADGGDADGRLHVQLFRTGNRLRARIRVVPGGASGPSLRPGQPPAEVVLNAGEGLVRRTRDLREETRRLDELLERCPTLASLPREGDDRIARELETCLELLTELREAGPDVAVAWPEGQPIRAPALQDGSRVQIRVRGNTSWLTVDGKVQVDESRVLDMSELLASASRAIGRFVPIGEDEYLALTDELRKKLDALARVQALGKGGRLSAALLPALDGICDGLDVTFGAELEKKREALERARTLEPRTPRDLATELRDYQRDGFAFLARRAEAGLGACLADDMGLGKTVQALALLLHRRKKGPALVVAPTSVCRNWEDEARRFAPALTVHRLAEGDRAACVEGAGRGDLVIASYGLLAAEAELLASRAWATVVYDEAHALKNASSRRWAAAREVKAESTIALTGTPVENHAGELHALFDLLVPGMLGSRSVFDAALGAGIADGDREAAALLRQLVRPFVLRRTKAEVLTELPPKTELLHVVSASDEHRAFYEAVRRRAAEKIEAAREAGGARAGRARIEILAEITRLRRAAIDPRLVGGADAPAGAKLDALVELVVELREEGRRALVFSQFLEVLDFARARLEERGIECRRLDGTMTQGARAEEVAAFQGGQGDVFLVSLKAGGVGMNLTAADVVILLDPWWNPAVEDQAAGRAHRIGQSRPVTVARIVTEGTIEEKVLALHAKKRQLFDDVVADADGGGTLDMEALSTLLA